MPQPFRYRQGDLSYGALALMSRPDLALKIALVMDRWSKLEHQLAMGFVALLRGAEDGAYNIYNALVDRGIRETVFLALARSKLPPTVVEKFEEVFRQVRKAAGARNNIAHGQWATVSTRPESLLLCPSDFRHEAVRDLSRWYAQTSKYVLASAIESARQPQGWLSKLARKLTRSPALAPPQLPPLAVAKETEFTEYKAADFDELVHRIDALVSRFWLVMREALLELNQQELRPLGPSAEPPSQSTP